MNQGISDQLSDIQQNIHRTYMTYDVKLQQSKEKGMDTLNGQLARTKKVCEEKVKWGINMIEKKTTDLIQQAATTLETKVQQQKEVVSTVVKNLSKEVEGMKASTLYKCKTYEEITKESFSKQLEQ